MCERVNRRATPEEPRRIEEPLPELKRRSISDSVVQSALTTRLDTLSRMGEGRVRDLDARRYFPASRVRILMPGAKLLRNGAQSLRILTRRFAPTLRQAQGRLSPIGARLSEGRDAKIDTL
jgi:hypothetical protein